jgi:hypothetical protein
MIRLSLYACTATTTYILRIFSSLFYVTPFLTLDLVLLIPLSVSTDKSDSRQPGVRGKARCEGKGHSE